MKKNAAETKAYIEAQQAEERKLLKIIQEADAERSKQKKQLEQVCIFILLESQSIFFNYLLFQGYSRTRYFGYSISKKKRRIGFVI